MGTANDIAIFALLVCGLGGGFILTLIGGILVGVGDPNKNRVDLYQAGIEVLVYFLPPARASRVFLARRSTTREEKMRFEACNSQCLCTRAEMWDLPFDFLVSLP